MKSLIKLNLVWKIKMFIVPVVIWDQRDERGRRFGRSRCDR